MPYKFKNGKVLTKALEYSVSYHCNLRCAGCSHLAPFSQKRFPPLESYCADIERLGQAVHTRKLNLLGGEPLLNPEISTFVKVAKISGIADIVQVSTNGLLLHTMNDEFWEYVDSVQITMYPGYEPKEKYIQIFKERALDSNTRLRISAKPNMRTTIVTEPHPRDWITDMIFKTCRNAHQHRCHMIHEGKLYKCAVPPFLPEYLLKMERNDYDPKYDAFDIHNSSDIVQELTCFLTSSKTLDACRFCLGSVGKRLTYHQLEMEHILHPKFQNIQRSTYLDPKLFLKDCACWYYRRFLEHFSG